jgi:hypothetical protein
MFKNYSFTVLFFLIFFILVPVKAHTIDGADSALIKRYWNKVNIKSISSLGNNLYNGIDNYIQLIFPDRQSSTYKYYLTTNNGELFEYDETSYLTVPKNIGRSFISIHVITDENDTLLIGKKQLLVLNLPRPILKIGNTIISDQSDIDKQVFYKGDTLKIFFTDDLPESSNWYKIGWFSIGYAYGKIYVSAENNGDVINDEAKNFLNKIKPGCEVNIKVNTVSPSSLLRNLPLVKFKIH